MGPQRADKKFFYEVIARMRKGDVYIHCKRGRDRTSVLVALYRVLVQGWDPRVAWEMEVLLYGYKPIWFYRRLGHSYERMVREL